MTITRKIISDGEDLPCHPSRIIHTEEVLLNPKTKKSVSRVQGEHVLRVWYRESPQDEDDWVGEI